MEEAPQAPGVSVGPGDHQGGGQRRTAPCWRWPPPLTPLWEQCLRCSARLEVGGCPGPLGCDPCQPGDAVERSRAKRL